MILSWSGRRPIVGGSVFHGEFSSVPRAKEGTEPMRQWKIRTKMITGLAGLALVLGLLFYSSYSQLVRDRGLANEISQLASELYSAQELSRWADSASTAHDRFVDISEARRMIDMDRLDESDLETQQALIDIALMRMEHEFEGYQKDLSDHAATTRETHLLVDRNRQLKSLEAIIRSHTSAKKEWEGTSSMDPVTLSVEKRHARVRDAFNQLVSLTHEHYQTIYEAMSNFRDDVHDDQRAKKNQFLLFTGMATFLIAFLAWQFWTLIVVPFRTLLRGSQLIASGHHQHKILLGTDDEIGSMADTVNDITERFNRAVADVTQAKLHAEQEVRDRTREVIQSEQLASVGFLAAGVAHEINNPLGAIAWSAEALEGSLEDLTEEEREAINQEFLAELATSLALIQSEAFRCKGITGRLLNFSRLSDSSRDLEDIGELVQGVVSMVSKVGQYRCKTLRTHCDRGVIAHCNSQEIQQVVLNLISNALESVDTEGSVDVFVRTEPGPYGEPEQAVVTVQDDGCGMDQEVIDHLFEPFFTRRRDNTGTGLGLSISYRIVSLHHGSLTPYSEGEGKGSRMVLRLPSQAAGDAVSRGTPAAKKHQEYLSTDWKHVQKAA
ncbi:HAMP domain-containing histidine kinase [Roseiconus nitratireducens]|uniref:histidine kinase n=1 Tax=Roseiconus nitratireducens TaxID=2605748 RepID=A0A5M6DEM0_9BACT|nr:HAMP domain-containing sensor histidine kinase [Roseiconus nitratireducens]KAA5545984.1 HAMP domain-containing histidine kinase [Roseiconus nitratireducens]